MLIEHSGGLRIGGSQPRLVSPKGPVLSVLRWEPSNPSKTTLMTTTLSTMGCGIDGSQFWLCMLTLLSYLLSVTMGNGRPQRPLRRRKAVTAVVPLQECQNAGGLPNNPVSGWRRLCAVVVALPVGSVEIAAKLAAAQAMHHAWSRLVNIYVRDEDNPRDWSDGRQRQKWVTST